MTDTPQTCGKGLAANSVLPSKLAELLEVQATVLERHMQAIDPADPHAAAEVEAYTHLAHAFAAAATQLATLASDMANYRDLPMPRHDPAKLAAPGGQMDAFRTFVALEADLVAFLQKKREAEAAMLNSAS